MSISVIMAAIAGLGAIVSGTVWLVKRLGGTAEEANEAIDKQVAAEKDSVAKGGRPQW